LVLDTLSVADRANLLELYARSVMLLDLGHCEEWADLFDDRASVRSAGVAGGPPRSEFKGREELLQLGRATVKGTFNLALGPLSPPLLCCHILSNVCLYAEGTHSARGYAHLLVTTKGTMEQAPRWLTAGIYSDRLRKCASGCWRLESRTFTPEGCAAAASVTLRMSS
jgi:hypothetical protein